MVRDRSESFPADLQSALLRVFNGPHGKLVWTSGAGGWYVELQNELPSHPRVKPDEAFEAVWSLVRQGLLYMNTLEESAKTWKYFLTKAGQAAVRDQDWNPNDTSHYIKRLQEQVREADQIVIRYADEAMRSYMNCCYLASAVMLGAATEAAFLPVATSFAEWFPDRELADMIEKPTNYVGKLDRFRVSVDQARKDRRIPKNLASNLGLRMIGVADLIRIHRNEAGHPTDVHFDREMMFTNLTLFPGMLRTLYDLKAVFDVG